MLEILMAKDLVYVVAGNMYVAHLMFNLSPIRSSTKFVFSVASVLSVLSIQIVNIHKMDSGVRMISEHRAQFCMTILNSLQDRLPVVAAFLPIYESLLKSHSVQGHGRDRLTSHSAPERSIQHEPTQIQNEDNAIVSNNTGGLFDQALQDSVGTMFPFSFPFGDLFEDVFLGSPSQPTSL